MLQTVRFNFGGKHRYNDKAVVIAYEDLKKMSTLQGHNGKGQKHSSNSCNQQVDFQTAVDRKLLNEQ